MNIFILRFGEVALKGANRRSFEKLLVKNIGKHVPGSSVRRVQGRFYLYNDQLSEDKIIALLRTVFGIVSFSPAKECELDIEKVKSTIADVVEKEKKKKSIKTFRITTNRIEKNLLPSGEMDRQLGGFVIENTGWKAQMKGMDLNIGVEVADKVFVYTEKIQGIGGLPVGIEGNIFLLIDSEDALVSGFIMMKRGCNIYPLVTDSKNKEVAERIISQLQSFSPVKLSLHAHPETEVEKVSESFNIRAIALSDKVEDMRPDFPITTLRPIVAFPDKTLKFYKEQIAEIVSEAEK
ncbi:hypothetical protein KY335_05875 [Candidatus Woesearchaeota archaeon]|nr:hypothetical protein [Candidatus Woesearchaeota archaeon]